MKTIEKIFLTFSFIGLLFLLQNYPFSEELLILFLGMLSILYMGFGFFIFNNVSFNNIFRKKTYSNKVLKIIASFVLGYSLSLLILGVLFKLMNWPFSNEMILIGLFLVFASFIISAFKYNKTQNFFYKNVLIRTVFWIIIGAFVFNLSKYDLIEYKYKNHPSYLKAYKKYLENPTEENENIMLEKRELMFEEYE